MRDVSSRQTKVLIIEVDNPSNIVTLPVPADTSVLVHPQQKILSMRGIFHIFTHHTANNKFFPGVNNLLQLHNIDQRIKLKEYTMSEGNLVFWKWISVNTLAIVTEESVYHWQLEGLPKNSEKLNNRCWKTNCLQETTRQLKFLTERKS